MAAANDLYSPEQSPPHPTPPPYPPAICRVAVAQICLTAGYTGAEAAALRALSDIAGRYIRSIAGASASAANSRGRTQSNILDLTLALEGAASGRGFSGAADVRRPVLRSSVLLELRAFVEAVDEIPFPRPLRRQTAEAVMMSPSFAQVGREPPFSHVPRWLPCFPEGWVEMPKVDVDRRKRARGNEIATVSEKLPAAVKGETSVRDLVRERGRVWFVLGGKKVQIRIAEKKFSLDYFLHKE